MENPEYWSTSLHRDVNVRPFAVIPRIPAVISSVELPAANGESVPLRKQRVEEIVEAVAATATRSQKPAPHRWAQRNGNATRL